MIRKLIYSTFNLLGSMEAHALERSTYCPYETQQRRLLDVVSRNAHTDFGVKHNFASIRSAADYQNAVPISTYEEIKPFVERMVNGEPAVLTAQKPLMFARTSGTAASPKYIPVTPDYLREFRRASVASGYYTLKAYPGIVNGVGLSVVSAACEGLTPGGLPYGAISGFLFEKEPYLIKRFVSPIPYSVFLIPDWESRYYAILRLAIQLPVSFVYTLNPSTIMLLARRLAQYKEQLVADLSDGTITAPQRLPDPVIKDISALLSPQRQRARELHQLIERGQFTPEHIWTELQVVCCWTKAAASFYLNEFSEFFGSIPVSDITYGASEGRGSVFLAPDKQVLALRSHFFEFVPEDEIDSANPRVLLAHELEVGQRYFILFTTSGGLYRYNINDVIKVTGHHNKAPLIEFQHKGGNMCSFTGEKISESQVVEAMSRCLAVSQFKVRFFTVVPQFAASPYYRLLVEPDLADGADLSGTWSGDTGRDFARMFDEQLGSINVEYAAKRESLRLAPIVVEPIRPGCYEFLRRQLAASGAADAQIKVSHLNPKPDVRSFLEQHQSDWQTGAVC